MHFRSLSALALAGALALAALPGVSRATVTVTPMPVDAVVQLATDFADKLGVLGGEPVVCQSEGTTGVSTCYAPVIAGITTAPYRFYCDATHCQQDAMVPVPTATPPAPPTAPAK